MPGPVLELIRVGEQLSSQSDGSFDLTVEPLLNLWGFGPQAREEKKSRVPKRSPRCSNASATATCASTVISCARTPRSRSTSTASRPVTRSTRLPQSLKGRASRITWRKSLANSRLPAKKARRFTLAHRVRRTSGRPASCAKKSSPSTATLCPPPATTAIIFQQNGRRYSHTFDARTGAPVLHALASVTVIHPSALMADGLSTLLLILGPERGWDYAETHDIGAFFVIRADTGFVTRTNQAF